MTGEERTDPTKRVTKAVEVVVNFERCMVAFCFFLRMDVKTGSQMGALLYMLSLLGARSE